MLRSAILRLLVALAGVALLGRSAAAGALPSRTLRGRAGWVASVAFRPDSRCRASGAADDTIRLWDAGTGDELLRLQANGQGITCLAFAPDGTRLVCGSADHTLTIWDAAGGEEVAAFRGHANGITALAVNPDGKCLVSGSKDTLTTWDHQRVGK
jgi:WD40 repeat protein